MIAFRRLTALFLALTLIATSQALAVARGQGAATSYIVICAGGSMAMMPVGPDGQPTGPAHYCPDGVLSVADAPAPVLAGAFVPRQLPLTYAPAGIRTAPVAAPMTPGARDPPVSV